MPCNFLECAASYTSANFDALVGLYTLRLLLRFILLHSIYTKCQVSTILSLIVSIILRWKCAWSTMFHLRAHLVAI